MSIEKKKKLGLISRIKISVVVVKVVLVMVKGWGWEWMIVVSWKYMEDGKWLIVNLVMNG